MKKGYSPKLRHVSRTHNVDLSCLSEVFADGRSSSRSFYKSIATTEMGCPFRPSWCAHRFACRIVLTSEVRRIASDSFESHNALCVNPHGHLSPHIYTIYHLSTEALYRCSFVGVTSQHVHSCTCKHGKTNHVLTDAPLAQEKCAATFEFS